MRNKEIALNFDCWFKNYKEGILEMWKQRAEKYQVSLPRTSPILDPNASSLTRTSPILNPNASSLLGDPASLALCVRLSPLLSCRPSSLVLVKKLQCATPNPNVNPSPNANPMLTMSLIDVAA